MQVKEITDKNIWEEFLLKYTDKTFLQSWNWGEFQKEMGNKIWRTGVYDSDKLIGVALVTKLAAKRGTFLLIQHGPTGNGLESLTKELKRIAEEEKASFIRIAPLYENNKENEKLFHALGFRKAPMHANAYESTWKLDIMSNEEDLMANMRKTTRYLIRQTQKNQDLEVYQTNDIKELDTFKELNRKVANRQKFVPFSDEYLRREFLALAPTLFFARYKEKVIAVAFVIFWSNTGFYHHAASLAEYAKISAPYLIQWEAIKEAKKRGCALYDFWGFTDPKKYPKHPWAGPTLFKMGFGGQAYEYVKTQDYPISKKYYLTYLFEKLRKIKRGL